MYTFICDVMDFRILHTKRNYFVQLQNSFNSKLNHDTLNILSNQYRTLKHLRRFGPQHLIINFTETCDNLVMKQIVLMGKQKGSVLAKPPGTSITTLPQQGTTILNTRLSSAVGLTFMLLNTLEITTVWQVSDIFNTF